MQELDREQLVQVDGGSPLWWGLMGAAIAVATAANTVYDAGKNLGEFVYTVTH